MPRLPLSDTRDWELVRSDQDLRGQPLWDAHGHRLGTIEDMIVDTQTERVSAVVLDTGDRFSAHDLSVGDDAVYVLGYDAAAAPPDSARRATRDPDATPGPLHRRDDDSPRRDTQPREDAPARRGYTDYTDDFRRHYDDEYRDRDRDYSDWEPAYRFGYDMAFEPEFAGRDFDAAEEDLRIGFYRRMGYPMSDRHVWDDVRGAVSHAFDRAGRDQV